MQDNEEERKPDLAGPDNEAIEEKVKRMLEPESEDVPSVKEPKEESDDATTAPELPPKVRKSIAITSFDEEPKTEDTDPEVEPEEPESEEELPIKVINLDEEPKDKALLEPIDGDEPVADEGTPESTSMEIPARLEEETSAVATAPELPKEPKSEKPKEPLPVPVKPLPALQPRAIPKDITPVKPLPERPLPDALDDDQLSAAVADIVAHESDELLAAEDAKLAPVFVPRPKDSVGVGTHIKHFFAAWWRNPVSRWVTILIVLTALAAAVAYPKSRYLALNTAGVRVTASVSVLDESTQQPLKNVTVRIADQLSKTDAEGRVKFTNLKLGDTELKVERRAFTTVSRPVTVGWGSNPLGEVKLVPAGIQYVFKVTDYVSGKPVEKAEAILGEASAFSDEKGEIKLTLEDTNEDVLNITLKGDSYRTEAFTVSADKKDEQAVVLVPVRKHVFISKRSGKYDIYKVDVDGKHEEKVLAGSGAEREDMILIPHPTSELVALVSTRDNKRNKDGYLLSTLTIINTTDNTTRTVGQPSERIHIVDWIGDRIIFVKVSEGASTVDPKRHRLVSYDVSSSLSKEIAASNYFNDVIVARGKVYYAPSSAYQENASTSFYKVDADGNNQEVILNKETWNAFRVSYDHLALSSQKDWYDYVIGNSGTMQLSGEPANRTSRIYVDAPDGKHSLWVDSRDGKGVLLAYQIDTKNELTLRSQSGLKNPVRWLNDTVIVYRVSTESETADYALSINGGEPKKIRDVSNTGGIDNWYYY
ncbi:MAG: hypothetical protein JWL85_1 [Candidatus Saccharibacteria bacterium]|nr:hypothetical protein [Candidatus Saccharibacteria bacterium]